MDMKDEKMAEEYVTKNAKHILDTNNAFESSHEAFLAGLKADREEHEWHKVLDGDLPKHNNEVLCLLWGGIKEIGYYKNELWYFEDFTADKDDVDYWQEIILPEE